MEYQLRLLLVRNPSPLINDNLYPPFQLYLPVEMLHAPPHPALLLR
jgi:hypothetical protein